MSVNVRNCLQKSAKVRKCLRAFFCAPTFVAQSFLKGFFKTQKKPQPRKAQGNVSSDQKWLLQKKITLSACGEKTFFNHYFLNIFFGISV